MRFKEHQSPGSLLTFLRTRAGLTQEELSERTGIGVIHIRLMERGARRASAEEFKIISSVLTLGLSEQWQLVENLRAPRLRLATSTGPLFDRFTELARSVLLLAQEEARRLNHNYIGTEHLLLGLARERDGVAARALKILRIDHVKVRSAVEFMIGRGEGNVIGEVGLTPRAKKVIELAVDEARRLNHHYIGSEHLLLGLASLPEGIAAGILQALGVELNNVRDRVLELLARADKDP
jgi:transcriptional regulator with XRE-family HTH domain